MSGVPDIRVVAILARQMRPREGRTRRLTPQGSEPPFDGFDDSAPVQHAFSHSAAIRRMAHSRKLSEVDVLDYDAVFFPGGLGPVVDIAKNPDVKAAVRRAWDGGKVVAAVCHGPVAPLRVNLKDGTPLVKGRPA